MPGLNKCFLQAHMSQMGHSRRHCHVRLLVRYRQYPTLPPESWGADLDRLRRLFLSGFEKAVHGDSPLVAESGARCNDLGDRCSLAQRRAPMKYFVGLDVGLEETNVCIVDSEGIAVREVKVSTEPAAIRSDLEGCADREWESRRHRLASGFTGNSVQPVFRSLLSKRATCVFRCPRCATRLIVTMRAASRR